MALQPLGHDLHVRGLVHALVIPGHETEYPEEVALLNGQLSRPFAGAAYTAATRLFRPLHRWHPIRRAADVLTGFAKENGDAMGRPVGVVVDKKGALLVADDVGNVIWRVTAAEG